MASETSSTTRLRIRLAAPAQRRYPERPNHAQFRRDSLTLVNPCCVAYGFIVVGMAAGPFLRCSMMGRRSSRSMSFVLRRSSAMSVGRALHLELSSAPTGWQLSEDRQGVIARVQRVSLARFVAALCARALART